MAGPDDELKFDGMPEFPDLSEEGTAAEPTTPFPGEPTSGDTAQSPAEQQESLLQEVTVPGEEEEQKPSRPSIWQRIRQTSPYVVMLGLSVVAILIAIGILVLELSRYQFEFTPHI